MDQLIVRFEELSAAVLAWLASPQFYAQAGIVLGASLLASIVAAALKARIKIPDAVAAPTGLGDVADALNKAKGLLFPIVLVALL
ncbi:MAG: hypothetical protein AAGL49_02510, partial [Pseudomonadota bacterium]